MTVPAAARPPSPGGARFDTYLFDLDGTLIDSIELILRSYRHTATRHLQSAPPDAFWLGGLGTPLRHQFSALVERPDEIEAMVVTYREYNRRHHDTLVREFEGVREAVRELKTGGSRLGIVTSKTRAMSVRGLKRCGLEGFFELIVGVDDVERHKPDPEPVLRALQILGTAPHATVFVGDSPHDMAAGRAAGVATAAALWGPFRREDLEPHSPDYWLERPQDITRIQARPPLARH